MSVPTLDLNDGYTIPQIGLGLWKVKDEEQFKTGFNAAIDTGYRHFDSAQAYGNERFLGAAWQASGVPREELFLTTKIAVEHFRYGKAHSSFEESLKNIRTDYVDLLLLHFPVTLLRKKAWRALGEIQAAGKARSIGVSNYTIKHLQEMESYAKVVPALNQVELHAFLQQPELIKYCQDKGIVVEAYSPLAHAASMDNKTIQKIADKHQKTYAQIMLRWLVEQGLVVLPKSITPSRIRENFQIFDFQLDDEDRAEIAKLDQDLRTCWNPTHVP